MTRLRKKLAAAGEPIYAFARRIAAKPQQVYRLCGGTAGHPERDLVLRSDLLLKVSAETGISVGDLVEDAIAAVEKNKAADAETTTNQRS